MPELGARGYPFILALRGDVSIQIVRKTVREIVKAIGMTTTFTVRGEDGIPKEVRLEPHLWEYDDELGFIYIQPIYESFIAFDGWPKHQGGYLTVFSCRKFRELDIRDVVQANGFKVVSTQGIPMIL